jgi:signal transduction histidine kinase
LYQLDSGRGTGLALVQRLVELQGGRCGYEPVQPRGSCFYFTLPAAPVPPSSPS